MSLLIDLLSVFAPKDEPMAGLWIGKWQGVYWSCLRSGTDWVLRKNGQDVAVYDEVSQEGGCTELQLRHVEERSRLRIYPDRIEASEKGSDRWFVLARGGWDAK